jgi:hypothetical protein
MNPGKTVAIASRARGSWLTSPGRRDPRTVLASGEAVLEFTSERLIARAVGAVRTGRARVAMVALTLIATACGGSAASGNGSGGSSSGGGAGRGMGGIGLAGSAGRATVGEGGHGPGGSGSGGDDGRGSGGSGSGGDGSHATGGSGSGDGGGGLGGAPVDAAVMDMDARGPDAPDGSAPEVLGEVCGTTRCQAGYPCCACYGFSCSLIRGQCPSIACEPIPCGAKTCTPGSEACVHPPRGGTCTMPDAGQCPPGTGPESSGGVTCCLPPDNPRCVAIDRPCDGPGVSCACFSVDPCGSPAKACTGALIRGGDIQCRGG